MPWYFPTTTKAVYNSFCFNKTKQNKYTQLGWIMATLAGRFKQNSLDSNVCKMFELLSCFLSLLFSLIIRNECVSYWMFMVFHLNSYSFCCCSFITAKWKFFCFTAEFFLSNVMSYNGHFYLCFWLWSVFSFSLLFLSRKNKHGKIHARKHIHILKYTHTNYISIHVNAK